MTRPHEPENDEPRQELDPSLEELRERRSREDPEAAERWERTAPRRRLAEGLIDLRRRAGMSQKQVAKAVGWNQTQVARMESATGPWPTHESLKAYAEACDPNTAIGLVIAHAEPSSLHFDTVVAFGDRSADQQFERLSDKSVDAEN